MSKQLTLPGAGGRRGFTLIEMTMATGILMLVLLVVGSILVTASWSFDRADLQTDADQSAVIAMAKLTTAIREAKQVSVLGPGRLMVIYPTVSANGYYNRFQPDYANPVFYEETNANGVYDPNGAYLWRREAGPTGGVAIARQIKTFRAVSDTPRSVRLTIEAERTSGQRTGLTKLEQRVLYLRNH